MSPRAPSPSAKRPVVAGRLLGSYPSLPGTDTASGPGPLVILNAGMHGNEPAGVEAVQRVLQRLGVEGCAPGGRLVALAGNLGALAVGRRYIDRDLNRQWDAASVERLLLDGCGGWAEDLEQTELLSCFDGLVRSTEGPVVFLDLHSMSAAGVPFVVACEDSASRDLARHLVLPGIVGLERAVPGTSLDWFTERGHVALAVEGGAHHAPGTVDVLESAAWLLLASVGLLAADSGVDLAHHRALLRVAAAGLPDHVTVTYRHGVTPEDHFQMLPGFHNLQKVRAGQPLARDVRGEVTAPESGWLLLPLYQPVGSDGFFLGQV